MGNYTPDGTKWGLRKEIVFRSGTYGGTQAVPLPLGPQQVLAMDYLEGDLEVPEPYRKKEEFRAIGGGQNVNGLIELGYEAVEKDLEMKMQSARALYGILGGCTTGNGVRSPFAAATCTSGQGTTTAVITLDASYTFEKNALAGFPLVLDGAGTPHYYKIVSNSVVIAATNSILTCVLNTALEADANTQTIWVGGGTGGSFAVDVVASGGTVVAGTPNLVTLTNTVTLAANALVGKQVNFHTTTVGDIANSTYTIVAHAAASAGPLIIQLNNTVSASVAAKKCAFFTFPFTHTIIEANTIPSWVCHAEQYLLSEALTRDMLGAMVTKVMITIEKGSYAKCTASLKLGKSIRGCRQASGYVNVATSVIADTINGAPTTSDTTTSLVLTTGNVGITAGMVMYDVTNGLAYHVISYTHAGTTVVIQEGTGQANFDGTLPAASDTVRFYTCAFPDPLTPEIKTWDMVNTTGGFAFTYNGAAIEGTALAFLNECDKMEIEISRDLDYDPPMGDEFAYKIKYGPRNYKIKMHFTPTTDTLYRLRNTKLVNYAGNLALTIPFYESAGEYINLVFNSLYLAEYPNQLVNYETRQTGVDFELNLAPAKGSVSAGTLAVTALDKLDQRYYEVTPNNVYF